MTTFRLTSFALAAAVAVASPARSAEAQDPPLPEKKQITTGGGRGGGALSAGIMVGNTLYLSGQLPARAFRDSTIGPQTTSAIENAKNILTAAGMTLADVVSVQAYLVDMADYEAFNAAYSAMFTAMPRPTRTTVIVKELVNAAKVELTFTAVKAKQ